MDKPLVFIIGAIAGSFLNVCIYRIPKKRSIVSPGSQCPKCNAKIAWYDNIPLLSYILLMGRCRACKAAIPFRYFLVEAVTAVLLLFLYTAFGFSEKFFAYSLMAIGLVVATFVDFEIQEIPDEVSIGGLIAGLVIAFAFPQVMGQASRISGLLASALGVLAGGSSIYLMGFFGELVFKKEAMGGGDVKLMAMIGAFLGWKLVLVAFFVAPLFGSIVGIAAKIRRGAEIIPYGPHLSLAAVVAAFWGEAILKFMFYRG